MTVEEIKSTVTMPDLAKRYGIRIHRGSMCSCPFHGEDKHPSMKIYKDGFKCFACGASGDVLGFVQMIENCDFKTAFYQLGGNYEKHENERSRIIAKARLKAMKDRRRLEEDEFKLGGKVFRTLTETIDWCKFIIEHHKPYTARWCIAQDELPELDFLYYEAFCTKDGKKELNGYYIIEKCRRTEDRLLYGRGAISRAIQH